MAFDLYAGVHGVGIKPKRLKDPSKGWERMDQDIKVRYLRLARMMIDAVRTYGPVGVQVEELAPPTGAAV